MSNTPALSLNAIASDVSVSPQIEPSQMAELARLGFKSVVNNRPDFEGGPDQPTSATMAAAAREAGMEYRHLPVAGGFQSPDEIAAFGKLMAELPRPVLCFCRSGARSTKLFVASGAR